MTAIGIIDVRGSCHLYVTIRNFCNADVNLPKHQKGGGVTCAPQKQFTLKTGVSCTALALKRVKGTVRICYTLIIDSDRPG